MNCSILFRWCVHFGRGFFCALLLLALLLILKPTPVAHAAQYTVINLNDVGVGSLRQAITDAMGTGAADTIKFNISGTITLGSTLPNITAAGGALTIDGTGQSITISGGNAVRVFIVNAGATLTLQNLTVANGSTADANGGGGVLNNGTLVVTSSAFTGNTLSGGAKGGGAISTLGNLTVTSSTFSSNTALTNQFGGGAIYSSDGTTTISGSTFSSNSANGDGGGAIITVQDSGTPILNINNSTFSSNQATGAFGCGGAIHSNGTLSISASTFFANQAAIDGGALMHINQAATITNSTFTGNSARGDGGAINYRNDMSMTLNNVTIASNTADSDNAGGGDGGGIFTSTIGGVAPALFSNTIIAGNSDLSGGAPDCGGGALKSGNNNLIQNTTGCTIVGTTTNNITGQNPLLGALASNGGPTQTRALLAGSPAIDHGNNATCEVTDQRGIARPKPAGGLCDIGAYEYDPPSPTPIPVPAPTSAPREVPEADTLLLMSGGLGGLATWIGWQWRKRRARGRSV